MLAKKQGIEVLALTDHDTVDGLEEAVEAGKALGLRVLRGVELSAREYPNLHILGYGFVSGPSPLAALCGEMREHRNRRKDHIMAYLRGKGIHIPMEEVEALAAGGVIGRPHFAQIIVRHGYAETNREVFDRWLDTEELREINNQFKIDARTCVETIRSAGGRVSLAHPCQLRLDDNSLEKLVRELTGYGLEAIECRYPQHTMAQQVFYLRLAEKYGLHVTGGSDFHGERVKPEIRLAALELDVAWLYE